MKKNVLCIGDAASELDALGRAVAGFGPDFGLVVERIPHQALRSIAETPPEAIVCVLRGGNRNDVTALNEVAKSHPQIARFVVADTADKDFGVSCVLGAHHLLTSPCSESQYRSALQRVLLTDKLIGGRSMKELIARMRTFPSLPSLYTKVMKELASPSASPYCVGAIIREDLAMSSKLIQLVNSAYFGLSRQVTNPEEAVMYLGMETVRSLVLSIRAFSEFDKVKLMYFSMDRIWRHSLAVAATARAITSVETNDEALADEAYTAGLLHDLGKLILASNFDKEYERVLAQARDENRELWRVETEAFGGSHADASACLAMHWGLPETIIEAVGLHHEPWRSEKREFSPLAAVHVANALEWERHLAKSESACPEINLEWISRLKLKSRLGDWRRQVLERASNNTMMFTRPASPELPPSPVRAAKVAPNRGISALLGRQFRALGGLMKLRLILTALGLRRGA